MESIKVTKSLMSRRYWLCGASSGIGFAVAQELVARGAEVILMSRTQEKLDTAKKTLGSACIKTVACDIADPKSIHKIVDIASRVGPFDGLLLNGGGPHGGKVEDLTWSDFDEAHRMLLSGPANTLIAMLPYLKKPGAVVSIASTTIKEPNANLPLSATYRLGLIAFLKNVADSQGPNGIRINTVAPGYTATEKLNDLADYVATQQSTQRDDVYRLWGTQSPLKRVGTPEEVAKVCAFLFSDDSAYITGQSLLVDGGMVRGY